MAGEEARNSVEQPEEDEYLEGSMMADIQEWIRTAAPWWAISFTVHMVLLSSLLLLGRFVAPKPEGNAPSFDEAKDTADAEPPVEKYQLGPPQIDPSELNTESLLDMTPSQPAQTEQINDASPEFTPRGGGMAMNSPAPVMGGSGDFNVNAFGPGPKIQGPGGIGASNGTGKDFGSGGDGNGFGTRGGGMRKAMLGRYGGTKATERAVAAALYWLAHHQMPEGNWSIDKYQKMCKDKTCTGEGSIRSDAAATAMGLLPYLAAGQTQFTNGPFTQTIRMGVYWLLQHQKKDGDLSADTGAHSQMYSHGLASIALCEDFGMTHDRSVGIAAQNAINFIQAAQNTKTGGWRYTPGEEGDTSVVGWQLMALKSAQMAGLAVNPATLEGTKKWLRSVSAGGEEGGSAGSGGRFSYRPDEGGVTPTMSAVGILCNQYLHAGRADPVITGGVRYLMANLPNRNQHNVYYWYYATQVMHNMADRDWDTWNRKMRTILVETQAHEGCSSGSWDPENPERDAWGPQGGRLMITSLSALTLEIYYRYLPLYKLDKPDEIKAADASSPADNSTLAVGKSARTMPSAALAGN